MSHSVHSSPDDIDPIAIIAAIKRSFVKLLIAALLAGLATFVVLSMMTPLYTSVAQLQFGGQAVVSAQGITRPMRATAPDILRKVDKEAVASQVAVIKSRDLAVKLIQELKLKNKPEFNSALAGGLKGAFMRLLGAAGGNSFEREDDRVLAKYDSALKVFQGKDTRVVSVQFTAGNPALAAKAANRLSELYLAGRATQGVKQSFAVSKWLKPEIDKLEREVQTAETIAGDYRAKNNLFAGSQGTQRGTLNNEQLSDLTKEITKAQALQSEADARARAIRDLMRLGSADASPDVMRSPLMQRLQNQRVQVERQVSELSATLLPAHPRMRQLRADLNGLKRQIRGEVRKIVDSLDKEAKVAGLRVASIRASFDRMKSVVLRSGGNLAKLRELERGAKAKRQQLEAMQTRLQAALARQRTRAVPLEAELFSRARASTIPTFPKKAPITLLAMAGIFLLGLAFIAARESLAGSRSGGGGAPNRGRRASDKADAYLEERRLIASDTPSGGTLAGGTLQSSADAMARVGAVDSVDRYAQLSSIGSVAQHLLAQSLGQTGYRTLLADEAGGNGAGDDAIVLANALAAGGKKVVLVDWCRQGSGLAPKVKLSPKPGITDLLIGQSSFEDIIHCLPGSDVHFIASGVDLGHTDGALDAERLNLVLDALDEAYDHIIIYGTHEDARALFECIQGRFDAGVSVVDAGQRFSVLEDAPGTFLGFEVSDLDIIRYERPGAGALPGTVKQLTSRDAIGEARL